MRIKNENKKFGGKIQKKESKSNIEIEKNLNQYWKFNMANNFRIKSFYIAKTLQIKSGGNNNDEK